MMRAFFINRQYNIKRLLIVCSLLLVFYACKDKQSAKHTSTTEQLYTCPMHPEIIRDKPGTCPICGMDLVKKETGSTKIEDVSLNTLLQPTDEFVVTSIAVTTIEKKEQQIEVDALGSVDYDTRLVGNISARVSGRIEKLYVKYRYQHIMKGQKIMDIYSPELLTAEQELLFVLKNDSSNTSLIQAAKQKLLWLGMSDRQLQQIIKSQKPFSSIAIYSNYSGHIHDAQSTMATINTGQQKMDMASITEELSLKEGMYIEKGQSIFQIYNVDRSWILLNIFPEYQSLVKVGNVIRVIPETNPAKNFRARIDFIEPFYRKENKTLTARVYFNNTTLQIPIGSQVRATIFGNTKDAYWLPKDAVISLGLDKIVFLKTTGGFKTHKVETGFSDKNYIQIINGLSLRDSVAINAQYLIDSESFIKVNN